MADYFVSLLVGSHTWTVEHAGDQIPDTIEVLAGMAFGWAMPQGIGPVQPDPMTATLAINVPSFADVADIHLGGDVAIEVRFDETAPLPLFAFYGRVTDVQAAHRSGRTGVTLSIAAVDRTVDLADVEAWALPSPDTAARGLGVLESLWDDRTELGALPDWPILPVDGPLVAVTATPKSPLEAVKEILLVSVDESGSGRLILAPYIGTDGLPDPTQPYTFDVIAKPNDAHPWEISAGVVERSSLKWVRNRRGVRGNTIEVSGGPDVSPVVDRVGGIVEKFITERLSTICNDQDELQIVADFYFDPPAEENTWAVEFVNVLTRVLDETELADIPGDLFPQWRTALGEPERSSCYGMPVHIAGVPVTENPCGAIAIDGSLCGASVSVAGGNVTLSTTVRRTVPTPPTA